VAPQLRNAIADDVPHEFEIDTEVVVDQDVAHAGHCTPLDGRMGRSELRGHLLGGFANDLKAPHERATQGLVGRERFERQALASTD
jgi:hypothetical protein